MHCIYAEIYTEIITTNANAESSFEKNVQLRRISIRFASVRRITTTSYDGACLSAHHLPHPPFLEQENLSEEERAPSGSTKDPFLGLSSVLGSFKGLSQLDS